MQNLALVRFLGISLVIIFSPNGDAESNWINHLVKYIENDLKISRLLMIIDVNDDGSNVILDNINQEIQFVPHNIIDIKNATFEYATQMSQKTNFQDLRSTTLILVILSLGNETKNSKASDAEKFLIPLHANESRSKCLMIVSGKKDKPSYKKFFHQMWLNDFLDITVIAISQKEKNSLESNRAEIGWIHQYNPFTNDYIIESYINEKQQIFANKLLNMNGFKMRIGTFNWPPFVLVKRNSTGYPTETSGPKVKIVHVLREKMNFTTIEAPSKEEWFGTLREVDGKNIKGLLNQLFNREIRFITNWISYMTKSMFCNSKVADFDRFCVLLPLLGNAHWNVQHQLSWVYFIFLLLILKGITLVMKFDSQLWSFDYILEAMLGFTVPREPRNTIERILFLSILISFTIFSSSIFAILTDTKITIDEVKVIDTLEKLNESSFTPMMRQSYASFLLLDKEVIIQDMLKKTLIINDDEECVRILVKHKNVSCFMRETRAMMFIHKYGNTDMNSHMTILDERIHLLPLSMIFEPASPFLNEFNNILTDLLESGIMSHWLEPFLYHERKTDNSLNSDVKSSSLLAYMLYILLLGYLTSFLFFVGEIISNYIGRIR